MCRECCGDKPSARSAAVCVESVVESVQGAAVCSVSAGSAAVWLFKSVCD